LGKPWQEKFHQRRADLLSFPSPFDANRRSKGGYPTLPELVRQAAASAKAIFCKTGLQARFGTALAGSLDESFRVLWHSEQTGLLRTFLSSKTN
jgi:hypothetical protein